MKDGELKYLIVASHRRSGTHWLIDTLFNNFGQIHHGYVSLDRMIPGSSQHAEPEDFLKMIQPSGKVRLLKTHTPGGFEFFEGIPGEKEVIEDEILPFSKIIYIYRDCRDVMLSLYFYANGGRKFDQESFNHFLEETHELDNIEVKMNRLEFFVHHVESWSRRRDVLFLRYEDLCFSASDTLKKVETFTGLKSRTDPVPVELTKYNKIQRGIRRVFPGLFRTTAVLPRKGIVGDWKNHSDEVTVKLYQKYCGEFLSRTGYGDSG